MSIKVGIIGLGKMGTYHALIAQELPNVELVAIADSQKKTAHHALRKTIPLVSNYKEILHALDAVIIATPTPTHYIIAQECLDAGLHILLEKPISQTVSEANTLFDKALQKGKILQIGYIERFNPAFIHSKKTLSSEPFFIESIRTSPFHPRVTHDSVLIDLMIHDIDLIIQLIDAPLQSTNIVGTKLYSSQYDCATAHLLFTNGTQAFCHANRLSNQTTRSISFHTKEKIDHLNLLQYTITSHSKTLTSAEPIETIRLEKENALLKELNHFFNAIASEKKYINNRKDLATLEITLALQQQLCS